MPRRSPRRAWQQVPTDQGPVTVHVNGYLPAEVLHDLIQAAVRQFWPAYCPAYLANPHQGVCPELTRGLA